MGANWIAARTLTMGVLIPCLVLAAGIDASLVAAQELPPDIEADRFLLEAERQIGNGDFAGGAGGARPDRGSPGRTRSGGSAGLLVQVRAGGDGIRAVRGSPGVGDPVSATGGPGRRRLHGCA